jgi:hypothetical protein
MGVYNPTYPQVLGQEWVGVRNEFYVPDTFREVGYTFAATSSRSLTRACWYTSPDVVDVAMASTPGLGVSEDLAYQVTVYPTGAEVRTGPIGRVVIPVMSGAVGGSVVNGASVEAALANHEGNNSYIGFGSGSGLVNVNFNTTGYASLLNDKRILRVNLVGIATSPQREWTWSMSSTPAGPAITLGAFVAGEPAGAPFVVPANEVSPLWSTTTTLTQEANELHAWRYSTLSRFSTTGPTPRLRATCTVVSDSDTTLSYLAMEVFYCAETRVAEGARTVDASLLAFDRYVIGATPVILRGLTFEYPTPIAAGSYTVTLSLADFRGNPFFTSLP